jgi:hypothetical protein
MTTQNPITPEAMTIRVGAEYAYRIRQTAIDGELVSFGAKGKTVRAVVIHADARFIRLSFRLNRKAMTISLNLAQFCGLLAGDEDGNRLTPALSGPEPVDTGAMHGPSFWELLRASFAATYAAEQRLVFDGDDWTPETEAPYREAQRRHFALCQLAPGAFTAAW